MSDEFRSDFSGFICHDTTRLGWPETLENIDIKGQDVRGILRELDLQKAYIPVCISL